MLVWKHPLHLHQHTRVFLLHGTSCKQHTETRQSGFFFSLFNSSVQSASHEVFLWSSSSVSRLHKQAYWQLTLDIWFLLSLNDAVKKCEWTVSVFTLSNPSVGWPAPESYLAWIRGERKFMRHRNWFNIKLLMCFLIIGWKLRCFSETG